METNGNVVSNGRSLSDYSINELWKLYKEKKSDALRNEIMVRYLQYVRCLAECVWTRLPSEVEFDDLVQAGTLGLSNAVEAFDPNRGFTFQTYSFRRIRGAIIDYLRCIDHVPRITRLRNHRIKKVTQEFEMEKGRQPDKDEILAKLGLLELSEGELQKTFTDSRTVMCFGFSQALGEGDSDMVVEHVNILEDQTVESPDRAVLEKDLRTFILRSLDQTSRIVIILYYWEELTMKEIGAVIGIGESRVSQLHASAITQLRAQAARGRFNHLTEK